MEPQQQSEDSHSGNRCQAVDQQRSAVDEVPVLAVISDTLIAIEHSKDLVRVRIEPVVICVVTSATGHSTYLLQ